MHGITAHRLRTSFVPGLVFACLLCTGAMPQAADFSNPGQATRQNDLPLQFSFSMARPLEQRAPLPAAGGAMPTEDCEEEDDAVPVVSIPHTPPAKATPPASPPVAASAPAPAKPKSEPVPQPKEAQAEPAPKPAPAWEISLADKTLSVALGRWAETAGWQLLWELPVDYAIEARTTVPGTFEEAVEAVAKSMEAADTTMHPIFYKGNKVLRIVAGGRE